jgi:hypothetical protein
VSRKRKKKSDADCSHAAESVLAPRMQQDFDTLAVHERVTTGCFGDRAKISMMTRTAFAAAVAGIAATGFMLANPFYFLPATAELRVTRLCRRHRNSRLRWLHAASLVP